MMKVDFNIVLKKYFGFVCFEKEEDANKALQTMNDYKFEDGTMLFVCIALPKYKRKDQLSQMVLGNA